MVLLSILGLVLLIGGCLLIGISLVLYLDYWIGIAFGHEDELKIANLMLGSGLVFILLFVLDLIAKN